MEYKVRCNKCETLIGDVIENINKATVDFTPCTTTRIKNSEDVIVFCPNCQEELNITKNENRLGQLTLL